MSERSFTEELGAWQARIDAASDEAATRAEGQVYLAGLAKWAIERAFAASDPDRPRFVRCMDPLTKWGLDNPDNLYQFAPIRGGDHYLIRGTRGSCTDLAIEILAGLAGDGGSLGESVDCIDVSKLMVGDDGRFEVHVGGQGRNALATRAEATGVFVRQTFADWAVEEPARLTIERLTVSSGEAVAADPWRLAARHLRDTAAFMEAFAARWREAAPLNALTPPSTKGSGFMPGQYNAFGRFSLNAGEAMLISIDPIPCRYHAIAIGHDQWFTSFDSRRHVSSLNTAQALRSADGRYRCVVCPVDPGVANWIDSAGHARGFMFMRVQGAALEPPASQVEVVSIGDARRLLPPAAARESSRQLGLDRRFQP